MIKKKDVIWCLLLVLLVLPLVVAVPPVFTSIETATPGLQISFPTLEFYPSRENVTFNFHVLNSTNFFQDTNVTNVICHFHVYNNNGTHIIDSNLTFDIIDGDHKFTTTKEILIPGKHSYLANCKSSVLGEAGFVSSSFEVTQSGLEENSLTSGILYLGVLFVLVFFLVLSVAGAWSINGENEYDLGGGLAKVNFNKHFKLGLFFLSYLLLIFVVFTSLAISTNFLFLDTFSAILGVIHYVLWILLAPVFLGFLVHSLQKFIIDSKLQDLAKRNLPDRKGGPKEW